MFLGHLNRVIFLNLVETKILIADVVRPQELFINLMQYVVGV